MEGKVKRLPGRWEVSSPETYPTISYFLKNMLYYNFPLWCNIKYTKFSLEIDAYLIL